MHSVDALAYTILLLACGKGTLVPAARSIEQSAAILLDEEHNRLAAAHLYYVSDEMTQLATAAAANLPDWSVNPTDLPAEQGFILFATPIGDYVNDDGDQVDIVACSWGRSPVAEPPSGGVWVTFWSATNFDLVIGQLRQQGMSAQQATRVARQVHSELTWDSEALLCWDAHDIAIARNGTLIPSDGILGNQTSLPWTQTLRAAWLLTQQRNLSDVTEEHVSRTMRRRAEYAGHNPAPVRVVRIRHGRDATREYQKTGRTVTVRFPVEGHWRDQPYGPGRTQHRRKYILPHWRGPEDAPVQIRPKVNLLDDHPDN